MKLEWNIFNDDTKIKIELVYNIYIGTKKLYVDGREILSLKKADKKNILKFKIDGSEYEIQLYSEGYGYTGYIITPKGDIIYPEVKTSVHKKTPIWVLPFIIINTSIPIISVEALTPWIIAASSSYFTVIVSKKEELGISKKLGICAIISILSWTAYFIYYLAIRNLGIKGGFITYPN